MPNFELIALARQIIENALVEALETMKRMPANEGQKAVYDDEIISGFNESQANSSIQSGWINVDIGDYMTFMGKIVSTGNAIMNRAYALARQLVYG